MRADTLTYTEGYSLYYYNFEYSKQNGIKLLSNPKLLIDSVVPHIAICKAANNIDNWIVTRKFLDNNYLSYKFNDNGINNNYSSSKFENIKLDTDTTSRQNSLTPSGFGTSIYNQYYLSFSPNSNYLFCYYAVDGYDKYDVGYKIRYFEFNNKNGILKDLKINNSIIDSVRKGYNEEGSIYISEVFSGDSKYLYFGSHKYKIDTKKDTIGIYQFKISSIIDQNYDYNYNYFKVRSDIVGSPGYSLMGATCITRKWFNWSYF